MKRFTGAIAALALISPAPLTAMLAPAAAHADGTVCDPATLGTTAAKCIKPNTDGSVNSTNLCFGLTAGQSAVNGATILFNCDAKGGLIVQSLGNVGVQLTNSSGNKANANAVCTLTASASAMAYITGFELTASGSTAGLPVVVTVTGLLGGTASYIFDYPSGALVGATPLQVEFPQPVPASAVNTNIVVTLPAGGLGNTNASCVAHGFLF